MTRAARSLLALLAATLACVAAGALPAAAAPVKTAHVAAELVSANTALVPGTTALLALRLDIAPGWHTYWRNPGESGLPTTLDWRLPPGYAAGAIEWPAPSRLPAGPLVNYGYVGEALHLVPITVPATAQIGSDVVLAARADWLVCRETCIPEGADLALTLPVAREAGADARWAAAIAAARAGLPRSLPAEWAATAQASGSTIALDLRPRAATADPGTLYFFANDSGRIEPSAPQPVAHEADGSYVVELPVSHELTGAFARLDGVLVAERGWAVDGGMTTAIALDVPVTGIAIAGPKPPPASSNASFAPSAATEDLSLPLALVFGFAGGLLLNLMPCVFPVLSLKALSLASAVGGDRRAARREGIAFGIGVLVAFAALGAAIDVFRTAGGGLGWGFQLQSPAFVATLAILFFVLALNLSGVFEFGTPLPSRAATWSHANRNVNGFATGVLAVAIASPCTAPFMGAALGYALTASTQATLGVFVALGVGMALPYVALAWFPHWRRVLPRPGPWLLRLKQLLAFPLYATVAWLVWVLGAQVGNDGVMRIAIALVLVAFALWAWRNARTGARGTWTTVAAIGAIAGVIVAWPLVSGGAAPFAGRSEPVAAAHESGPWQNWSTARVAALVDEGRPVFVDFTAAWCITCQVNERLVLDDSRVRDAFANHGVALLRADWTRRDPAITEALADLGRTGVPVYVLYRKGFPPLVLPAVLRRAAILDALTS